METLIKAVKDEKEKLGTALIIECQSSPHEDIALRSDIYIGSDPFHTPLAVLFSAVRHFRSHGYRVKVNEPIAKTTVPKQYFQTDKDVCSMRIEIDPALLYDDPEALQSTISSWLTGYLEKS